MSKTNPVALEAHMQLGTNTVGHLLKVTRSDGEVFAFTSASDDVTSEALGLPPGVTYRADPGLNVSSLVWNAGFAVDNLELIALDDGEVFTHPDVVSGIWRNASFEISRYNWASPSDGVEPLLYGTIGNVNPNVGHILAELRGLQQYLQQPIGIITSKNCRARLGDEKCTVDLGPYTFSAAVTSLTNNQVFAAGALGQADDYFGEGLLTWDTGDNAGLTVKVKTFSSTLLTLTLPMLLTVQIGDTFTAIAGCRKRHDRTLANITGVSDCLDKFDNVLNFQGEPHMPGIDALTKGLE